MIIWPGGRSIPIPGAIAEITEDPRVLRSEIPRKHHAAAYVSVRRELRIGQELVEGRHPVAVRLELDVALAHERPAWHQRDVLLVLQPFQGFGASGGQSAQHDALDPRDRSRAPLGL